MNHVMMLRQGLYGEGGGQEWHSAAWPCHRALISHISAKISLLHQHISREFPVLNKPAVVSGFLEKRAHKKEIIKNKT